MRINRITISNFMGWKNLDIDLSAYSGVIPILGCTESSMSRSNGTGKSSLIAAIVFSISGKAPTKNLDEMIRLGSSSFKVVVEFTHSLKNYRITRRKTRGGALKSVFEDVSTGLQMSITPQEFFGISEAIWGSTVYSAQGKLAGFLEFTPSVRKDLLTEIFGLGKYLDLEATSRTNLLAAQNQVELTNQRISMLKDNSIDLDSESRKMLAAEGSLRDIAEGKSWLLKQRDELTAKIAANNSAVTEVQLLRAASHKAEGMVKLCSDNVEKLRSASAQASSKLNAGLEDIERSLSRLPSMESIAADKQLLAELESAGSKLPSRQSELAEIDVVIQKILSAQEQADADKGKATTKLSKVGSQPGICPTCGTHVDESSLHLYRKGLEEEVGAATLKLRECTEVLSGLRDKRRGLVSEISALQLHISHAASLRTEIESKSASLSGRAALEARKSELSAYGLAEQLRISQDLVSAQKDYEAAAADAIAAKAEYQSRAEEISGHNNLEQNLDAITTQLASADTKSQQIMEDIAAHKQRISDAKNSEKELSELSAKLRDLELDSAIKSELVKAFGPTGIPTLILENYLAEMQQYVDEYMQLLSDGRIQVTFQTTKTNVATGKTSETLSVLVTDATGQRDISLYSGGEKVRVYIAMRLALAKLLRAKGGEHLGVLIIDEVADLDAAGLSAFVDLLKRIGPEYEQVFLVSHLSELKSAFDNTLVLRRDLVGNHTPENPGKIKQQHEETVR